jgi:hypothetical protein
VSNDKKRLQVILTDETWGIVDALNTQANENFETGSINYSDVINEMILCSKVEIKLLQQKHTNIRRSLKLLASKADIDLDSAIKCLMELKARQSGKKKNVNNSEEV